MKQKVCIPLIKQKSKGQGVDLRSSVGTLFMILSGIILYLDKIIVHFELFEGVQVRYYSDVPTFIWVLTQTLSPFFLITAFLLKASKWSSVIPVVCYSAQLVFITSDVLIVDDSFFWFYTALFVLLFYAFIRTIFLCISHYQRTIDSLKKSISYSLDFIIISVKNTFISDSDKPKYVSAYMKLLKKLNQWN